MLGVGWTEMLVIGVVALIVIGPKELPALMRRVGQFAGTIRRMGQDFQRELNKTTGLNEITNLRNSVTQPLKATAEAIRKEFNTTTPTGEVKPSGVIKPADPKAESVVDEIKAAAGMTAAAAAPAVAAPAAAAPKAPVKAAPRIKAPTESKVETAELAPVKPAAKAKKPAAEAKKPAAEPAPKPAAKKTAAKPKAAAAKPTAEAPATAKKPAAKKAAASAKPAATKSAEAKTAASKSAEADKPAATRKPAAKKPASKATAAKKTT